MSTTAINILLNAALWGDGSVQNTPPQSYVLTGNYYDFSSTDFIQNNSYVLTSTVASAGDWIAFDIGNRGTQALKLTVTQNGTAIYSKSLVQGAIDSFVSAGFNVNDVIQLTVTTADGSALNGAEDFLIVPINENLATGPIIIYTVSISGDNVTFTDSSKVNTGDTESQVIWNFGDTQSDTQITTLHTYASTPTGFVPLLAVVDSAGNSASRLVNLFTSAPTTASFIVTTNGLDITATNTSSAGIAAPIISYVWNFGDGSNDALTPNAIHTYGAPGTYTVTLTITDSMGVIVTTNQQVTVVAVGSAVSTYVMKGFLSYDPFDNNAVDDTAPFGELTTYSKTFSPDTQVYVVPADQNVALTLFTSATTNPNDPQSGGASSGNASFLTYQAPGVAYTNTALSLGAWLYNQAVAKTLATDQVTLANNILAEFTGLVSTIQVGVIIANVAGQSMPEWVSYVQVDGTNANYVKLWFSDASFREQYDQYTIRIVPPVANLDDFFQASTTVIAEIHTISFTNLLDQAQQVSNAQPYTMILAPSYGYLNPDNPVATNPANFTPVPWPVLIYGLAGNNVDSIKQALINYILANSTHTENQWSAIFPDIFNTTEFIITPMWDQYSVPNLTLDSGVYSPIVNAAAAVSVAQKTAIGPNYTANYIGLNVDVVNSAYKSMSFLSIGSPTNRNAIVRLVQQWPDYMSVGTTNPDFNRMQPATQQWIMLLQLLFQTAEIMTTYSDLPKGVTRLIRGNIMYAVANYQNVDYLVVSRQSLETIVPITPSTSGAQNLTLSHTGLVQSSGRIITDQFSTTGQVGTVVYGFTANGGAPAGGINANTGALSLTYTSAGTYSITVTATDNATGALVSGTFSVNVA